MLKGEVPGRVKGARCHCLVLVTATVPGRVKPSHMDNAHFFKDNSLMFALAHSLSARALLLDAMGTVARYATAPIASSLISLALGTVAC